MIKTKIVLFVESYFLNNSSGINTFIKNLIRLLNENEIMILTDGCMKIQDIKYYEKMNINIKYSTLSNEELILCDNIDSMERYRLSLIKSVDLLNENDSYLFIANGFLTLKLLSSSIFDRFKQKKMFYYTHIGDILEPNIKDYHDFKDDNVIEILEILKGSNIISLTQTDCVKDRIYELIMKESIVLPEPVYLNGISFKRNEKNVVLIVASNYKRKRFDIMLKLLSKIDCKIKIVCSSVIGYYDIWKIASEHGIDKTRLVVYEDVQHSQLKNHVINSVLLLHISDIEICPYAVLEASVDIPTIINSNAIWSKSFDNISYFINPDNEDESIQIINDVILNKSTKFNYEEYMNNCKLKWNKWFCQNN